MVMDQSFNSVFEYHSAFDYGPADIEMKPYRKAKYKSAFSYHSISIPSDEETESLSKESLPFLLLRNVITFFLYLMVAALFPFSCWICIKRINSLERIVLMRLGKLQPIKGPGFVFILPFVDKWTRVNLRPKTFTVETSQLPTADGGIVEAWTDIEYRVADVLSYVLKLRHQDSTLQNLGLFCLKNIISQKDQEDLQTKQNIVCSNIKDELNRSAVNWGLEVIHVNLHPVKVIKGPESVDVVGTLMTALKAAIGQPTETHTSAMFPLISDLKIPFSNPEMISTEEPGKEDYLMTIEKIVNAFSNEELIKDLSASILLNVKGMFPKKVLISFNRGNVSVLENSNSDSDIELTLTDDTLKAFLNGSISPREAYMGGRIEVKGDYSLLQPLTQVIELCASQNGHIA